jgi:hypothetical protein
LESETVVYWEEDIESRVGRLNNNLPINSSTFEYRPLSLEEKREAINRELIESHCD